MAHRLKFEIEQGLNLNAWLQTGLKSYLLKKAPPISRPTAFWLFSEKMGGLKIRCQMHDVAPRLEVGTLAFSRGDQASDQAKSLGLEWREIEKIYKLEIQEGTAAGLNNDAIVTESGIVLVSSKGSEIAIVASEAPYSVEISGLPDNEEFRPQYAMNRYIRVPFT